MMSTSSDRESDDMNSNIPSSSFNMVSKDFDSSICSSPFDRDSRYTSIRESPFHRVVKDDETSSCSSGYSSLYSNSRPKSCFIESILDFESIPCNITVIPSKRNKYYGFDVSSSNDLTIIKQYDHTDVGCLSKDGLVRLPMTFPRVVNFTPILNGLSLETAGSVRDYRRKCKLNWIVSTTRFVSGDDIYEPGQIFNVSRPSFIKKYCNSKQNGLRVTPFPRGKSFCLPYERVGNFKVCASPHIKITRTVADIIENEEPPYLLLLPSNHSAASDKRANQVLYVYEKNTSHILIAIQSSNDGGQIVHTIPLNLPIEVVVNSSCKNTRMMDHEDIKLIVEKLIKVDTEYALRHHQTCSYEDIARQSKRKMSTFSILEDGEENSLLLDTTDDILKQFLKYHEQDKKLPSQQFYRKTGSIKKVASFWSIFEEVDAEETTKQDIKNEPIYEAVTPLITITLNTSECWKRSTEDIERRRSSTFEKFTLIQKKRISRLFSFFTGKTFVKEPKDLLSPQCQDLLSQQCQVLPRNSCSYLNFHHVDVERECNRILDELTTSKTCSRSTESSIKTKLKMLQLASS